jgi:predicted RNase H-like HicB family nuclease
MNNNFPYPIIIYPAEEGGYVAEIPALKGCLAQGETLEECLQELKTVQAFWLESARRIIRRYRALTKEWLSFDSLLRNFIFRLSNASGTTGTSPSNLQHHA